MVHTHFSDLDSDEFHDRRLGWLDILWPHICLFAGLVVFLVVTRNTASYHVLKGRLSTFGLWLNVVKRHLRKAPCTTVGTSKVVPDKNVPLVERNLVLENRPDEFDKFEDYRKDKLYSPLHVVEDFVAVLHDLYFTLSHQSYCLPPADNS